MKLIGRLVLGASAIALLVWGGLCFIAAAHTMEEDLAGFWNERMKPFLDRLNWIPVPLWFIVAVVAAILAGLSDDRYRWLWAKIRRKPLPAKRSVMPTGLAAEYRSPVATILHGNSLISPERSSSEWAAWLKSASAAIRVAKDGRESIRVTVHKTALRA